MDEKNLRGLGRPSAQLLKTAPQTPTLKQLAQPLDRLTPFLRVPCFHFGPVASVVRLDGCLPAGNRIGSSCCTIKT
jgi:hypothetical protein